MKQGDTEKWLINFKYHKGQNEVQVSDSQKVIELMKSIVLKLKSKNLQVDLQSLTFHCDGKPLLPEASIKQLNKDSLILVADKKVSPIYQNNTRKYLITYEEIKEKISQSNLNGCLKRSILKVVKRNSDEQSYFKVFLSQDDLRCLMFFIQGPIGSPYEKGIFQLSCQLSDNFPFKPPVILFLTIIRHPNIYEGQIKADFLKEKWSPVYSNLETVILSIVSLLNDPNFALCTDQSCLDTYETNQDMYFQIIRDYKDYFAAHTLDSLIFQVMGYNQNNLQQLQYLQQIFSQWMAFWTN